MKRANGSGSVVRLSGNRRRPYMVRVSAHDEYGHIVQRALSYHEKAAEAQAALEEYNRSRLAGTAPTADRMNATLQEVFDGWKARSFRKFNDSSIRSYTAAWNKRVSRYADRKIRTITLDDWQQILDDCEAEGLSPDEHGLLGLYRSVNPNGRKYIVKQAEFAAAQEEYRLAPTAKTVG